MLLTLVVLLGLLPTTAFAVEEENIVIDSVSATITLPTAGAHPVETGTAGDSLYTIAQVRFYDSDSHRLDASDTFKAGETYGIYVSFHPNSGYTIEQTTTATINGMNAIYHTSYGSGANRKFIFRIDNYTVPRPPILGLNIQGITAPVAGETANTSSITINNNNHITISDAKWHKITRSGMTPMGASEKFDAGKQYYLIIQYDLAYGYTVSESAQVMHDLPGGTVGHSSATNTISIAYTVPETYTVTVITDGNGTASADPAKAAEGTTVTLTATPYEGYELDKWEIVSPDALTLSGNSFSMPANDVTVKASFKKAVESIDSVSATITLPTAGAHPVETGIPGDSLYAITRVDFYDSNYHNLDTSDTFKAGETYVIYVRFRPNSGYTIERTATVTINGMSAEYWTSVATEGGKLFIFRIEYTVPRPPILGLNIQGITAPVAGETANTSSITINNNNGVTVSSAQWHKEARSGMTPRGASDKFQAGKRYFLIIEYTLAESYTISERVEIMLDLPGGSAVHDASAKKIVIIYTVPEPTTIDTINIIGITAPAPGKSPVTDGITTDTAGVTLKTVQWLSGANIMGSSDKFVVGETYTLYISYEPQSGYEIFNGVTVTSDLGSSTILNATSERVNIQYTVPEAAAYTVTVTDGTAREVSPANGEEAATIQAKAGSRILLKAAAKDGKVFIGWSGLDGITLYGDGTTTAYATLQFIMPEKNVTVTANYIDESAANVIKNIDISGITTPLAGANPNVSGITVNTESVRFLRAYWALDGAYFGYDKTFEKGEQYCLYVWVELDDGYYAANNVAITADIDYDRAFVRNELVYIYFTVTEDAPDTATVSGKLTSYGSETENVTIHLIPEGTSEAAYEAIVTGNATSYSIANVAPGTYTLRVSKKDHATRDYTLVVGNTNVTQDVKLCLKGDVTGDGAVNIKDFQRLLRHVNKTNPLEGYALACGDITGDGVCNIKDFQRLLRHVNKTNPLF